MYSLSRFQVLESSRSMPRWGTLLLRRVKFQRFKRNEIKFRCYAGSFGGPSAPYQIGPSNEPNEPNNETPKPANEDQTAKLRPTLFKMLESAATTLMSIVVLG